MKGALVCLLVCVSVLASVCAAADPTRPNIADQFYAEVHVSINDNGRHLRGGGK